MAKTEYPPFICLDLIPACGGQTDGQRDLVWYIGTR